MNDPSETKTEMIEEISVLKQGTRELEQSEVERKQVQEELRKSEARYRTFFEQAAVGVAEIEIITGRFLTVNRRLCELVGRTEEELLATTFMAITHPDDLQLHEGKLALLLAGEIGHYTLEKRYISKDGATIWVNITVSHSWKPGGKSNYNIIVVEDITSRKLADEELRKSEERFRAIADYTYDWENWFGPDGKLIWISSVVFRFTGYSVNECLNIRDFPMPLVDEADREKLAQHLTAAVQGASANDVEFCIRHKDGGLKWAAISYQPIYDSKGANLGHRSSIRDITERKRAEEERKKLEDRLQQADKMEAIGTLAGGIAHDFNNLLMGIHGYASLSLMNLDPSHPNYERLKRIEEQVQSGADLTRQLLGFARGGRYEVKPADMNDILETTSSMFGRTKKEITIHRKYGKDLRPVEVDRGQMEQVFMNLYVNAWQAMPGGGGRSIWRRRMFF